MNSARNTLAAILVLACFGAAATAAAQYEVLYTFPPSNGNAPHPVGSLRTDLQGNLFGDLSDGSAFELTAGTQGFTEKPLPSGPGGGDWIADAKGNYYKALTGSKNSPGEIIAVSPVAGGFQRKTIYSFGSYATDGAGPSGTLVFDTQGNLYGTTSRGGSNGRGTVFQLSPSAQGSWKERVLYRFGAFSADAVSPINGLTIDSAGNLYGTTNGGGISLYSPYHDNYVDGGTVFKLTPLPDGEWGEGVIYDFIPLLPGPNGRVIPVGGSKPATGLILDNQGNLYGGAMGGGGTLDAAAGAVFKLSTPSGFLWSAAFVSINCDNHSECYPGTAPALDGTGNLYSTTQYGGSEVGNPSGYGGTVFQITPQSGQSVLHNFPTYQTDGHLNGGVAVFHGNLYGVTSDGGPGGNGTVWEIHDVASGTPVETTTSISVSPNTLLLAGQSVTLTATVAAASGPLIPTGTLTFVDPAGGSIKVLLVAGRAVYSGTVPAAGTYSVYASYSGDPNFAGSRSATVTELAGSVGTP